MGRPYPFVVTVASEKGGVGKTTIATNLTVYLKALREDLPVTIASFDNHFSIDQMFAIGRYRGKSVAGLFAGTPAGDLATMGEYGVQFLASERELRPPDDDPRHLRHALAGSDLPGILILDTRPVLDYFTRNALLAADLVLVPVKDRPSLVNASSLLQALREGEGDPGRVWLLPSLVDARLRLRGDIGLREFLTMSARERDYQVLDTFIAKSPKVEGLATSFSTRLYPVLTHARCTAVHGQLKELAEFVLGRFDAEPRPLSSTGGMMKDAPRRVLTDCPLCRGGADGVADFFFQDLRGRRRGVIHGECLAALLAQTELSLAGEVDGLLALTVEGPGLTGPQASLNLHLFDAAGQPLRTEAVADPTSPPFGPFLEGVTGRLVDDLYREVVLISLAGGGAAEALSADGRERLAILRRQALRELLAG